MATQAYDYIVVGLGLAGVNFCEQLRANGKTFMVFNDSSQKSSTVAGGLYNPVVLKRFTAVWKHDLQLNLAIECYNRLEKLLKVKLDYKLPVYRKFASVEEQNNWFTASDKPKLTHYLAPNIIPNTNTAVQAEFGYGEVLYTGKIDVKKLITAYTVFLKSIAALTLETFKYQELHHDSEGVTYKDIKAKHIVFAEGFGVTKNPFFPNVDLRPTKGEVLTIHAPELKIDFVLKGPVFLIPLGDDLYKVGATYELYDLTHKVTEQAKTKLLKGLDTLLKCPYTIVDHVAGIRPTVRDRRPLVGQHPEYSNVYLLNGLGTRGVMIGPYVAKQLYEFIEHKTPLERDINVSRVYDRQK